MPGIFDSLRRSAKWPLLLCLWLCARARAAESVHFGYNESFASLTDSIRLSTRIGYSWWSANQRRYNVENNAALPYSYHDGYVELIGQPNGSGGIVHTAQEAADRWWMIRNGQGDPWTGVSGASIGKPTVILLDEINTAFKDVADAQGNNGQGPYLREALRLYLLKPGASRSHIIGLASPSLSMGSGVVQANYDDVIYCANNYLRYFILEVYVTQSGFLTGFDPGETTNRGTGDTYLSNRLTFGIRNWTTTMGVNAARTQAMILISNRADQGGTDFYKFLNREFWFVANGWYNAAHSGVDNNIKTARANGVGTYNWQAGTGTYQLNSTQTTRDVYFEKYFKYYCVDGNTAAHPDGLAATP